MAVVTGNGFVYFGFQTKAVYQDEAHEEFDPSDLEPSEFEGLKTKFRVFMILRQP